jgi:hypothetical protein
VIAPGRDRGEGRPTNLLSPARQIQVGRLAVRASGDLPVRGPGGREAGVVRRGRPDPLVVPLGPGGTAAEASGMPPGGSAPNRGLPDARRQANPIHPERPDKSFQSNTLHHHPRPAAVRPAMVSPGEAISRPDRPEGPATIPPRGTPGAGVVLRGPIPVPPRCRGGTREARNLRYGPHHPPFSRNFPLA